MASTGPRARANSINPGVSRPASGAPVPLFRKTGSDQMRELAFQPTLQNLTSSIDDFFANIFNGFDLLADRAK